MEKEKLEKHTTERLRKRKKIASIILVILFAVALLDLSVLLYNLFIGHGFNISLFVPALACFVISIPIYLGKKKIDEELKNR